MKKTLLTLSLLFSLPVTAQSYLNFHQYIYSLPVHIQNGQALKSELIKRGYDFSERDWLTITLHMNGIDKNSLQNLKSSIVYLPPKKAYSSVARKIASTQSNKKICEPVSKNYLVHKFGKEKVPYLDYFELITSRKIEARSGTSLYSLLSKDHFAYGSPERAIKLIKEANGIRHDYVEKDGPIHLPFCADTLSTERVVASVTTTVIERTPAPRPQPREQMKTTLKPRPVEKESKMNVSGGINIGTLEIKRSSSKLSTNFAKAGAKIRKHINSDYSGAVGISAAQFYNITHSDSKESKTMSSVYPEFAADVTRHFDFWNVALAYDTLNYFVASDNKQKVVLKPEPIHRLSLKPLYQVTDQFSVFGGVGYLKNFGKNEITGTDYSAGVSYLFGERRDYTVAALFNSNTLDTAQSNAKDESQSWVLSFVKAF